MTARDEASGYMEDAFQDDNEASWEQLLDAIPPNVKARLAIDEGGLIEVDLPWPEFPLYRLVEP